METERNRQYVKPERAVAEAGLRIQGVYTLKKDERIFRFVQQSVEDHDPRLVQGCWWMGLRAVRDIVTDAKQQGTDLATAARMNLAIARAWENGCHGLVVAKVAQPLLCFYGPGKLISPDGDGRPTGPRSYAELPVQLEDAHVSRPSMRITSEVLGDHLLPDSRIEQLYIPGLRADAALARAAILPLKSISVADFWHTHGHRFGADIVSELL